MVKGAYVSTKDGEGYMVEGYKVEKVVDTVGAGDGFATGVAFGGSNPSLPTNFKLQRQR